jgi:hypothetical protein
MQIIDREDHVAQELERAMYARPREVLPWAIFGSLILAALLVLVGLAAGERFLLWAAAACLGVAGLLAATWAWIQRRFRQQRVWRNQLRAGLAGQEMVPDYLSTLPDDYVLINNLPLPGLDADVDHILVGPNGVFVIETKHHRGIISSRNGRWYQAKVSHSGWLQPEEEFKSPTRQVRRNVNRLRRYLDRSAGALCQTVQLWMEPLVVFTHPETRLQIPDDVRDKLPVAVLHGEDLFSFVVLHEPRRHLTKSDVRQVVSVLGHMGDGT